VWPLHQTLKRPPWKHVVSFQFVKLRLAASRELELASQVLVSLFVI
jgi:hypothetical protein